MTTNEAMTAALKIVKKGDPDEEQITRAVIAIRYTGDKGFRIWLDDFLRQQKEILGEVFN